MILIALEHVEWLSEGQVAHHVKAEVVEQLGDVDWALLRIANIVMQLSREVHQALIISYERLRG